MLIKTNSLKQNVIILKNTPKKLLAEKYCKKHMFNTLTTAGIKYQLNVKIQNWIYSLKNSC